MKELKVEINEPFKLKITINGTDFFKGTFKVINLKGERIIPRYGDEFTTLQAEFEQTDGMYLKKNNK